MNACARWILGSLALAMLTGCQAVAGPSLSDAQPAKSPAEEKSRAAVTNGPMIERRETIVATGYAVISVQNAKVPAQQRLLAFVPPSSMPIAHWPSRFLANTSMRPRRWRT